MASTTSRDIDRLGPIETQTTREVSIETRPTPENIARCNGQSQSPLFGTLPPEIRNHIFSLALLQYEDLSKPYEEHNYCYRPGHRARRIVSTGLLQTCRLVWLEANHWPMTQAVHAFWFNGDRRPDWARKLIGHDDGRCRDFFHRLTSVQHSRVKHIHIFAQMYWLEGSVDRSAIWESLKREPLNLDSFTITIRHSDWWSWEGDAPLRLEDGWVRRLLRSPEAKRIAEFRLELETLEWRVNELRPIVEQLRLAGEAEEGEHARWELVEPFEETTWSGPTNLGEYEHDIYADREKLDYRVIAMVWRRRVSTEIEQRWKRQGSLLKLCELPRTRVDGYVVRDHIREDYGSEESEEEPDERDLDEDYEEESEAESEENGE